MIEDGRPPFKGLMATAAVRSPAGRGELPAVNIVVAARTDLGRRFERDILQTRLERCGFMAGLAGCRLVVSFQYKGSGIVVESLDFLPRSGYVTGLASCLIPVRAPGGHPLCQFAIVGIPMTVRAGQSLKVIRNRRGRILICPVFMALAARYCPMSAGKRETELSVPNKSETGRCETLFGVAIFTLVFMRQAAELSSVNISMTGCTNQGIEAIDRLLGAAPMAFGAGKGAVFPQQGEFARHVPLKSECRGFETFHRVAGRAISTILSPAELSFVWILFVAIKALGMRHRDFEIGAVVAGMAAERRMFALERENGGSMIESRD